MKDRKRIWEVDCLSMDAVLAASFEWKDLANILRGQGGNMHFRGADASISLQVHNWTHRYCHSANNISLTIEGILNLLHQHTLSQMDHLEGREVMELVLKFQFGDKKKMAGLFWAIATDSRDSFECIRRRLHQRFQIFAIQGFPPAEGKSQLDAQSQTR